MKQYILSDVDHVSRTYGRVSAFGDSDARKRAEVLGYTVHQVITGTDETGVVVVDCQTAIRDALESQEPQDQEPQEPWEPRPETSEPQSPGEPPTC